MSIVFTAGLKLGAPTKINPNANVIVEQEIAEKKVENLQEKEQLLRQSFQDVAKLQVATGTIDMSYNLCYLPVWKYEYQSPGIPLLQE